jgi:hypothetical protein
VELQAALYHFSEINQEKKEPFAGLDDWKLDRWNKVTLENFISDGGLKTDKTTGDRLRDLDFWIKRRRLREAK